MSNQRKAKVGRKIKKLVKSKAKKTDGRKNFGPRKSDNNYKINPYFQAGTKEVSESKIGNHFYQLRGKHGRDKIFSDPVSLLENFDEYVLAKINNPWYKVEYKGKKLVRLPTIMPLTWDGFCIFCGVAPSYFKNFRVNLSEDSERAFKLTEGQRVEFTAAFEIIEKLIRDQKYNGAAAGYFKENLISYDIGIRKDVEIEATSSSSTIIVKSDEDRELLESIRKKLKE